MRGKPRPECSAAVQGLGVIRVVRLVRKSDGLPCERRQVALGGRSQPRSMEHAPSSHRPRLIIHARTTASSATAEVPTLR
eukprot:9710457-Alexandrium_andersonii.AAC.1